MPQIVYVDDDSSSSSSSDNEFVSRTRYLAELLLITRNAYRARILKFKICNVALTDDCMFYRNREFCKKCNCHVPTLGIRCKYCFLSYDYVINTYRQRCNNKTCRNLKCGNCKTVVVERPSIPFKKYFRRKLKYFLCSRRRRFKVKI